MGRGKGNPTGWIADITKREVLCLSTGTPRRGRKHFRLYQGSISVRIYNGKTHVRCKITEGKVGHKFGEFSSTRKRRPSRTNIGPERKRKARTHYMPLK